MRSSTVRPRTNHGSLVDELAPLLARLVFRYTRDRHATEDLVQETFLRVFRNLPRFRGQASVKTWAFSIARNLCLDYLRSAGRSRLRLLESLDEAGQERARAVPDSLDPDPCRRLDLDERRARVDQALSALTPRSRTFLVLRVYDGLSYREIAERCGIQPAGVGTRVSRALRSVGDRLGPCGP